MFEPTEIFCLGLSSGRLLIIARGFFRLPKLLMLIKSITSHNLGSYIIWQIANSFLNKGKYAIPSLFNGYEVFSSLYDKASLFLSDSGLSLLCFPFTSV